MDETSNVDSAVVAERLDALADMLRLWRANAPARQYDPEDESPDALLQMLLQVKASTHPWPSMLEPVYQSVETIITRTVVAKQGLLGAPVTAAWWAELIEQAESAAAQIERMRQSLAD